MTAAPAGADGPTPTRPAPLAAAPQQEALPLPELVADLASRLSAAVPQADTCVVWPLSADSLLEGYVAHILAARSGLGNDEQPGPDDLASPPRGNPDEPLSPCVIQELGARGYDCLITVSTTISDGRRMLRAYMLDTGSGEGTSVMEHPFLLPPELEALVLAQPAEPSERDSRWLRLFERMFASGGWPDGPAASLERTSADYLFGAGLWQEAASRLLPIEPEGPSARFMRGVVALHLAGDTRDAVEAVQQLVARHPDSGPLYCLYAWLTLREGRADDALMRWEQARLSDMARPGLYHFARALIAMEQGNRSAASEAFADAADSLPEDAFIQREAARFHWNSGDLDRAVRFYRRATESPDATADTYAELALVLRSADDTAGAIVALRRAFRMRSSSLPIARHLSSLLRAEGDFNDAMGVLQRASQANPCRADLMAAYGDAALDMWRVTTAEDTFRAATRTDPEFAYARVGLAATLALQRRYTEAQALLTDLLAREPEHYAARLELGRILGTLGHLGEALGVLTEATRSPEHDADARIAMSTVHLEAGNTDDAVRNAQIAVSTRGSERDYAALTDAFLEAGEPEKAEVAASEAARRAPDSALARLSLALALAANGKNDAAMPEVDRALEINPYLPKALELKGRLLATAGDHRGCARLWERALGLNEWNADLHRDMAELLREDLNDRAGALRHYTRCLELEELREEAAR